MEAFAQSVVSEEEGMVMVTGGAHKRISISSIQKSLP
jgi:hypothetical protein